MLLFWEILVEIAMVGSVIAAIALLAYLLRIAAHELFTGGAGSREEGLRRARHSGRGRTARAGSRRARDAAR